MIMKEVVVFCGLIVIVAASVGQAHLEPKPDKFKDEPGCYLSEFDSVVPVGEKVNGKSDCVEYTCAEDLVHIVGCVKIGVTEDCKLVQNATLPFPDCCPHPDCTSTSS